MDNNFHITEDRQVEVLINQMERCPDQFKHLQIFLHREGNDCKSDCEFLMVSPSVFGKVKLKDIQFDGNYIRLEFWDYSMQKTGYVRININEEKPSVLFVCWKDIIKIVNDEKNTSTHSSELLDFDY